MVLDVQQWVQQPNEFPVSYYITRINEQRGPFKDVTEAALEDEIANGSSALDDASESSSNAGTDHLPDRERDRLMKIRNQILQDVNQAHTDSALARDFVSLILTRKQQTQASITISQPLKERVPLGSIGEELTQLPQLSDDEQRLAIQQTGGLELEAFDTTVNSIVSAAERLETDIRLETEYWQQVVHVAQNGWSVRRLSGQKHNLGVRIGSLESGQGYRTKGVIPLNRSHSGAAEPLVGNDLKKHRRLHVKVCHKGAILAEHYPPSSSAKTSAFARLEEDLIRARDSLFDEELFYELSREAGQLWVQGVKFTDKGIVMPLAHDIEVIMNLVGADAREETNWSDNAALRKEYALLPELMSTALRISLCSAYRQNRSRRAAVPRPLVTKPKSRPVSLLLLPLISQIQHQEAVKDLDIFLKNMNKLFSAAHLDVQFSSDRNNDRLTAGLTSKGGEATALAERLIISLSKPPESSFNLDFQLISARIRLSCRNHGSSCEYWYQIRAKRNESLLSSMPATMSFQTEGELLEAAIDIMRCCLIETLQEYTKGRWKPTILQAGEMQSKRKVPGDLPKKLKVYLSQAVLRAEVVQTNEDGATLPTTFSVDLTSDASVDVLAKIDALSDQ